MGTPYGILVNTKHNGYHFTIRKKMFVMVATLGPNEWSKYKVKWSISHLVQDFISLYYQKFRLQTYILLFESLLLKNDYIK